MRPADQSSAPGLEEASVATIAEAQPEIPAAAVPPAYRRDPFVGEVLEGKYEILAPIARGGMGRVYRARQIPLDREVALKVLDMERHDGREPPKDFQKRFLVEAAACAKLTHPNTVVIHDYGRTDDGIYFIAMEHLEGSTFRRVIDEEAPLPPARVLFVALQICGSLSEAHARGMVHRDLKPSNVMLTNRSGTRDFAKVLDFGLVKQTDVDDAGLTQSGALLGTPRYIAPEQIASSKVGPESDIYSLGAVMYHALTGRPPFDSDSKFVLLASHINVEPTPIREAYPASPASDALVAVVMRCLAKEPEDRFGSMAELATALTECPEAADVPSLTASHSGVTGTHRIPGGITPPDGVLTYGSEVSGERARPRVESTSASTVSAGGGTVSIVETGRTPPVVWAALAIALVAVIVGGVVASGGGEAAVPAPSAAPTTVAPAGAVDGTTTSVRVITDPPGARIRRGDVDLGDAPTSLLLPRGETWTVEVELD
ncbi:MAG: serine/threonine-protein kinase, partial [Myxococcota bacterium]